MGGAVTASALLMTHNPISQPVTDKPFIKSQTKPDLIDNKSLQQTVSIEPRLEINETASQPPVVVAEIFTGAVEVLQESYVEHEVLDENWDEEAHVEEQRRLMQYMSEEELAAHAKIQVLEAELQLSRDVIEQDEALLTQMEQLLKTEDEYSPQLLDLQCSPSLCRVAINVVDEYSQLEVLDSLSDQLEWVDQSYADVQVKLDDSRIVTVYLTRLDHSGI